MAQELKARLARLRSSVKGGAGSVTVKAKSKSDGTETGQVFPGGKESWEGWTEAGHKTLKRTLACELSFALPEAFQKSLAILIPDFLHAGIIPAPDELLFFDLETTGLSGGAGTVAFLAAFGRFKAPSKTAKKAGAVSRIEITQYLLLDYPGESDFIEAVVKEFAPSRDMPEGALPFVVSYNGKTFDSQILITRCLMNGVMVPEYRHADLLHPARRLWRRLLPDCSQATIEVSVLGLDRTGDVSGAMAPDIWFSFLKTENNTELISICDHNVRDIYGLSSLFLALAEISSSPFEAKKILFDEEALAVSWRITVKNDLVFFGEGGLLDSYLNTGELLLEAAAKNGKARAAYVLARELYKEGREKEGRSYMQKAARHAEGSLKAVALSSLAIDSEWRLKNPALALEYTLSALEIPEISKSLSIVLEKRRVRLESKNA